MMEHGCKKRLLEKCNEQKRTEMSSFDVECLNTAVSRISDCSASLSCVPSLDISEGSEGNGAPEDRLREEAEGTKKGDGGLCGSASSDKVLPSLLQAVAELVRRSNAISSASSEYTVRASTPSARESISELSRSLNGALQKLCRYTDTNFQTVRSTTLSGSAEGLTNAHGAALCSNAPIHSFAPPCKMELENFQESLDCLLCRAEGCLKDYLQEGKQRESLLPSTPAHSRQSGCSTPRDSQRSSVQSLSNQEVRNSVNFPQLSVPGNTAEQDPNDSFVLSPPISSSATSYLFNSTASSFSCSAASSSPPLSSVLCSAASTNHHSRPQTLWQHLLRNHSNVFVPRITVKPFGISPIPQDVLDAQAAVFLHHLPEPTGPTNLSHPYKEELDNLSWRVNAEEETAQSSSLPREPPGCFVEAVSASLGVVHSLRRTPFLPSRVLPLSQTVCSWVTSKEHLIGMIEELSGCYIVGIDVENHSMHSYRGFTALLQLSTGKMDWLVDPFQIFDELYRLNEVTANPRILKVLHSAQSDILWLQRDFSVYIVNMFDTSVAAAKLELEGGISYQNILKQLLKIGIDKSHQMADWRQRPIPKEMETYARKDAHYLPYLYQELRNRLYVSSEGVSRKGSDRLVSVMEASKQFCLKTYTFKPFVVSNELRRFLDKRHHNSMEITQRRALAALLLWRDQTSRVLDESPWAVLKDFLMVQIVKKAPTTQIGLLTSIRPVPAVIMSRADEIMKALRDPPSEDLIRCHPTSDSNDRPSAPPASTKQGGLTTSRIGCSSDSVAANASSHSNATVRRDTLSNKHSCERQSAIIRNSSNAHAVEKGSEPTRESQPVSQSVPDSLCETCKDSACTCYDMVLIKADIGKRARKTKETSSACLENVFFPATPQTLAQTR